MRSIVSPSCKQSAARARDFQSQAAPDVITSLWLKNCCPHGPLAHSRSRITTLAALVLLGYRPSASAESATLAGLKPNVMLYPPVGVSSVQNLWQSRNSALPRCDPPWPCPPRI